MNEAIRLTSVLAVVCATLIPMSLFGQDSEANEKSLENPDAGIFKLPDLNLKVFEVGDEDRPRIGWVIELTTEEEMKSLHNFRYCDGTTGRVERAQLRESSRRCGQDKFGGTLKFAGLPVGEKVVVISGERKVNGTIVSIQESQSGGYVGIVKFDPKLTAIGFGFVPAQDGDLKFPTGMLSDYTEADIAGFQKQWLANSNDVLSASPGLVDFGVGVIVGVATAADPSDVEAARIGLSFEVEG